MAVALSGSDEKIYVVEAKKDDHCVEGGALVAVDERMVAGNAKRIGSCKRSQISFAVGAIG